VICASVRSPLEAAAKALLAEGHAPETETAMQHKAWSIIAMRGKIGTLTALAGGAADPGGPLPPQTGSHAATSMGRAFALPETDERRP
jgi:hypothetical protein